jgi:hypothetical protein
MTPYDRLACASAPRMLLPDASGYLIFLDTHGAGIACERCGKAMAFAVIRQHLSPGRIATTRCCVACDAEGRVA